MPSRNRLTPRPYFLAVLSAAAIAFSAATVVQAQEKAAPDFKQLEKQQYQHYGAANYKKALAIAEKMHKLQPKHANTVYNVACLHSLLGHEDKALAWLEKAVEAGFNNVDHLVADDDFKSIRAGDEFRAIVKRMRGAADKPSGKKAKAAKKAQAQKPKIIVNGSPPKKAANGKGSTIAKKQAKPGKAMKQGKQKKQAKAKKPGKSKLTVQETNARVNAIATELVNNIADIPPEKAMQMSLEALEIANSVDSPRMQALANYNVACTYSKLNKKDQSFKHLGKTIKIGTWGPNLVETIEADSDFDNIRKDSRYAKMLQAALGKAIKKGDGHESHSQEEHEHEAAEHGEGHAQEHGEHKVAKKDEGHEGRVQEKKPARKKEAKAKKTSKSKKPAKPKLSIQDANIRVGSIAGRLVNDIDSMTTEEAMELSLKALKIANSVEDPALQALANYNVACMYSKTKKNNAAFKHLNKTIDLGGWGVNLARTIKDDADFNNVRKDRRYTKAIEKALGKAIKKAEGDKKPEKPKKKPKKKAKSQKPKKPDKPKQTAEEAAARFNAITSKLVNTIDDIPAKTALEMSFEALQMAKNADSARLRSLANYNVACMNSRMKKKDAAFKHLGGAIELGGWGVPLASTIEADGDFDNVRDDSRYADLLKKAAKSDEKRGRAEPVGDVSEETTFRWKVTLPRNRSTGDSPLIVALHPYGGNMENTIERWGKAAEEFGAILLTPQGTQDMMNNDRYHWGRSVRVIERNVMKAINAVLDEHDVDQEKIVLTGFSQGGWATWALALRNPDTFCGIIPVGGMFAPTSQSYFDDEDLGKLRVFIMIGENERDRMLTANKLAAEAFRKAGAKVKHNVYKGVGHDFPDNAHDEQVKALKFVLGK